MANDLIQVLFYQRGRVVHREFQEFPERAVYFPAAATQKNLEVSPSKHPAGFLSR